MSRKITPKKNIKPGFSSIESLRAFYNEIGAPIRPHYKTVVRVEYVKGGSYTTAITHTELDHILLKKKGHKDAKRVVVEVQRDAQGNPVLDSDGNTIPMRFVELTSGLLYAPLGSNTVGQLDYEWALCLKIDGDLARAKTGDVVDGLAPYLSELNSNGKSAKKISAEPDGRGAKKKTNTADLLERYKKKYPEAEDWIREHEKELDSADFSHDKYRDPILRNAVPLYDTDTINTKIKPKR